MKEVVFRVDEVDPWEHLLIIDENHILLSDELEDRKLSVLEVLKELAKHNVINLSVEKIE